MKRLADIALLAMFLVAMGFGVLRCVSWARASVSLSREQATAAIIELTVADIRVLQERPLLLEEHATPNERFVGMASEAATQAALGSASIKSVEAEQESSGSSTLHGTGASVRRQSVRVAMDSMALTDIGRFLERWNALHPSWTPTRIDLSPAQVAARNDKGAVDTPPKWNVRLTFTSVYLPE